MNRRSEVARATWETHGVPGREEEDKKLEAELHQIDIENGVLFDKMTRINFEIGKVQKSIRDGAMEKLKVNNPANFDINMGGLKKGRKELQEGADAFASLMGRGTLDGQMVTMHTTAGNRGHYDKDGVYLPPINRSRKVVAHELGHWLEDKDRDAHARALAFLQKRTEGESAISLSRATGNPGYRVDETCKKDKFMNPYAGKIYKGGYATEIISMGIEHMYSEPVKFATEDPEYFDLTYNLMRGQY